MNKQKRITLYEKLYFHELDRREKISSRLSTYLGALVGTSGVLAFLLNSNSLLDQYSKFIFWAGTCTSIVALLTGAWHFRRAWFGHTDRHVATATEIDNYYNTLVNEYKDQPNAGELIEGYFDQFLLDTYRRSATTNAKNNDQRSRALYLAGCWITCAAILTLLSAIPYYLSRGNAHVGQERTTSAASATAAGTPGQE